MPYRGHKEIRPIVVAVQQEIENSPGGGAKAAYAGLGVETTSAQFDFDPLAFVRSARLSPEAARRHSRMVRYFRLLIPAAAVGLLVTYALSATPPRVDLAFRDNFRQADVETSAMRLDRPRYAGEDLQGLPFEVAAKSAARDPNAPSLIDLENPEALRGVAQKDGTEEVTVTARSGQLNTEAKTIDLAEDVRLQHSLGGMPIVFNTQAASVDLEANTVSSTAGVTGTGEQGSLEADNVTVFQGEGRAVLEGNVRLRLEPKKDKEEKDAGLR